MSVAYFLGKSEPSQSEVVAQIGKDEITRQDWLNEMEGRYGKEVLDEMIDGKVIEAAGDKYDVEIDKEEIDREIKMLKSAYGTSAAALSINEDQWRKQIKDSLMLEELLTKEVSISEEKLQQYFEDNQAQYEIKDTYHLSQIVLATKEEAEQTVKELSNEQKNHLVFICDKYISFYKELLVKAKNKLPLVNEVVENKIEKVLKQHQIVVKSLVEEG